MKVLENTPAVLSLGKLCDENGYSYEWINSQKPHLILNRIRIQCDTENFVPIVVPGLSAISSSSFHPSTSMTPSRQESHHPTSSSSSSSSPTSAVSSDSETREREDQSGIHSSPVPVSRPNVEEMIERETRCLPWNQSRAPRSHWILKSVSGYKNSEKISWMMEFLNTETHKQVLLMDHLQSPHPREVMIWLSTMCKPTSLKTEIARSVRGPTKLQGPRAEDAMVEPYLVLKILVTW